MQTIKDKCYICGNYDGFTIDENATLLREAKCTKCGAILRTSDLSKIIVNTILKKDISLEEAKEEMNGIKILNFCSAGHIHECLKNLQRYICFEVYDDIEQEKYKDGILCSNFEDLAFNDEIFDVVISEDVLEHVINVDYAFKEIERVLKKGGHHFFTIPFHENRKTQKREGKNPIYHGDPIRKQGALVITDWGYDINEYIESDNVKVKQHIVHKFHEVDDITDVDKTYKEYKTIEPLKYYKYNSIVFDCTKQGLEYTGERYVPNETSDEMTIEHMQRYLFAQEFVKQKIVLDAACGEGYGSSILNKQANKVYAIDLDEKAINEARNKYHKDNIQFCVSSIENLPFQDKMFDTIISFETIEHVKESIQQSFLKEVNRTLKDDGIFIISTPNKRIYTDKVKSKNIYHEKEFYKDEFLEFLSKYFQYTYVFNQHFRIGYFLEQEGQTTSMKLDSIDSEDARYYVVICSHNELKIDISKSYEVFNNSMYFDLIKNCNKLDRETVTLNKDFNEFRENARQYIHHLEQDIKQLKEALTYKDEDIEELKEVIAHRDSDIAELNNVIEHGKKENLTLKEIIKHPIRSKVKKILNKK